MSARQNNHRHSRLVFMDLAKALAAGKKLLRLNLFTASVEVSTLRMCSETAKKPRKSAVVLKGSSWWMFIVLAKSIILNFVAFVLSKMLGYWFYGGRQTILGRWWLGRRCTELSRSKHDRTAMRTLNQRLLYLYDHENYK